MTESVPVGKLPEVLDAASSNTQTEKSSAKTIGRNEPCPCGSGKKFKRCCGIDAAPKLTESKKPAIDPSALGDMNPEFMAQVGQALQRLPRGQLQRLQSMMQRAMSGADVSAEAAELEKNLPPDFKNLMQSWQGMAGGAMGGGSPFGGGLPDVLPAEASAEPTMTEEEARKLVEEAAKQGAIPAEQAEALLQAPSSDSSSKFGKLWRGFSGKNKS
jgi:hypothetical protein